MAFAMITLWTAVVLAWAALLFPLVVFAWLFVYPW